MQLDASTTNSGSRHHKRTLRRRMVGPMSIRQLKKQGPFSAALQGWTEYGPRVCVDKVRARCRRDIGPTSLRKPQRLRLREPPQATDAFRFRANAVTYPHA